MRYSTRAEYGLMAMVNLAKNYPHRKNIKQIGREEKISLKYLEKLMGKLKKNNLVKSQKGKSGGYALNQNPKLQSVGPIIEILEGSIAPMKCAESDHSSYCNCPSSQVWIELGRQIKKTLYKIKLSDLIRN
jgi:Rrf2 family protein